MITPMTGLIALLIIALIGWVVAELKDKCVTFVHSEEEAEGEEEMREAYEAHGGRELNLKDLLAYLRLIANNIKDGNDTTISFPSSLYYIMWD